MNRFASRVVVRSSLLFVVGLVIALAIVHFARNNNSVQSTAPCSAKLLFQAAATKEGFHANDPSYVQLRTLGEGPSAFDQRCDGSWAVALVSRPLVGTTNGVTVFHSTSATTWSEVGQTQATSAMCQLTPLGVPNGVATVLSDGVRHSSDAGC